MQAAASSARKEPCSHMSAERSGADELLSKAPHVPPTEHSLLGCLRQLCVRNMLATASSVDAI